MPRIPGPGRDPLPEGQHKKLVNMCLKPRSLARLKTICFRRSVLAKEHRSEGDEIEHMIWSTKLPAKPTAAQVAEARAVAKNPSRLRNVLDKYETISDAEG